MRFRFCDVLGYHPRPDPLPGFISSYSVTWSSLKWQTHVWDSLPTDILLPSADFHTKAPLIEFKVRGRETGEPRT